MADRHGSNGACADIVGIIPMAGRAARLTGLPCSKEIFPLPPPAGARPEERPQAVCEQLLGELRTAGIDIVYLVIRDGKWDIPEWLGDGSQLGLHLAYLMMGLPWGPPYSIDQAHPFVRGRRVALGFPDMRFHEPGIFSRLLAHQSAGGADVVLGLFPADRPQKVDMVELDGEHRVKRIVIKPAATNLVLTWGIAVWTPAFTEFLHHHLLSHGDCAAQAPELHVGDVVNAAIGAGLDVQGVQVSSKPFIDIGTWDDLRRAFD